jgi:hypothetical protein
MTNHSGDTTRDIEVRIGLPVLQQEWSLDDNPGWAVEGLWAFGQPTGEGGDMFGNPDPSAGATGEEVFGVNLNGDYFPMPQVPRYLTSQALDISNVNRVSLDYQRWLNIEGPPLASATVELSVDGNRWATVWTHEENVEDATWSMQSHDLTALAGDADQVYLRWGYGVHETGAMPCSGWNVDDIALWGVPPTSQFTLTLDRQSLYWTPLGAAVSYDVMVGSLDALLASGGDFTTSVDECALPGVNGTSAEYLVEPEGGEGQWILVRGVSSGGPMTFESLAEGQVGLRDDEIAAGAACP